MLGELEDKIMDKIKKLNTKQEEKINNKVYNGDCELKLINKNLSDIKDLIKQLNDNIKNIKLGPLDNYNYTDVNNKSKQQKNKKTSNKEDFIPSIDTNKMSYKKNKKQSKNIELDDDIINSINNIKNDKGE